MAAGLFMDYLHGLPGCFQTRFPGRVALVGHQHLVDQSQFVWQQTIESIFQLKSGLPNWLRLTHAHVLALVGTVRAMPD